MHGLQSGGFKDLEVNQRKPTPELVEKSVVSNN